VQKVKGRTKRNRSIFVIICSQKKQGMDGYGHLLVTDDNLKNLLNVDEPHKKKKLQRITFVCVYVCYKQIFTIFHTT